MRFAKGHGTENDFVILVDPDGEQGLPPGLATRLCDRRAGIGADGVLRAVRTTALAGGAGISGTETNAGEIGEIGGTGGTGSNSAVAGNGSGSGPRAAPEWFMDYRNSDGSPCSPSGSTRMTKSFSVPCPLANRMRPMLSVPAPAGRR